MAVRATVLRFPSDLDAQESSGLPWGVTVTPFASKDENGNSPLGVDLLHLRTLNGLSSDIIARHSSSESSPETMSSFIDLEMTLDGSEEEDMQAWLVYVVAIDLASSEEFLELTKSALLAALEALTLGSLFGLATFSHKLGLYDVQGPIPVVKKIFLPADFDGTLSIELEDAMPLFSFLAPVETCKDRIASALETLRPTSSWEGTGGGQGLETLRPTSSWESARRLSKGVEYLVEASAAEAEAITATLAAAKARQSNGEVELSDRDRGAEATPCGKQIKPDPDEAKNSATTGVRLHHRAVVIAAETGGALGGMVRQLSIDQFENVGRRVSYGTPENATAAKILLNRQMLINSVPKKCPRQPGITECGYYVLKFMKEIFEEGIGVLVNDNIGGGKDLYTDDDMDEIREDWLTYVTNFIFR